MNQATQTVVANYKLLERRGKLRHAFLDYEALDRFVESHWRDEFKIPNWRFHGVYAEREWAFATTELAVNSWNAHYNIFGQRGGKYMVPNSDPNGKPFTGAFAMQRRAYEHWSERVVRTSDLWPHVESVRAMETFFGGLENLKIPNPELKRRAGLDYVVGLEQHYQGNPLNLLEDAMIWDEEGKRNVIRAFNGGRGLVELLVAKFPIAYGEDIQELYSLKFPFYKRAQLVAVLLHGRSLDSRGILPPVADIDEVGPIVDYEVPKPLRREGILKYSEELAELVDNWRPVLRDSDMEIEHRGATAVGVFEFLKRLNSKRASKSDRLVSPLNICHEDYWLWFMGKQAIDLWPILVETNNY